MSDANDLISAIHHDRLASFDGPEAKKVCQAIGRRLGSEVAEVIQHLGSAGISASVDGDPSAPAQRHSARVVVADAEAGIDAAAALESIGYRPWDPIDGAAGAVHRRFRNEITVASTTDLTVALTITWPSSPGSMGRRFPLSLVPNENDFDLVALPRWLWPLYFAVRPLRLAAERVGLRSPTGRALGPFLSTPLDLIPSLLDLVDVEAEDVVVDLGCGDGRILIEAAAQRGCRGVGVESNLQLVEQARKSVAERGLSRQIEIVHQDAATSELPVPAAGGTVFFIFVPAHSAVPLVVNVLGQAKPGSRILVHEQHPLPEIPSGSTSVPLIAGQGVTVAHHWAVT